MKKLDKERLLKLADHIENPKARGHRRFDFNNVSNSNGAHCGTAGCAMGELPILFPKEFGWSKSGTIRTTKELEADPDGWRTLYASIEDRVADFFDISLRAALHLFFPEGQDVKEFGGKKLKATARASSVAYNIREFVARQ